MSKQSRPPAQNAKTATKPGTKPTLKKTPAAKWATPKPPAQPVKPLTPFQKWVQRIDAFDEFIGFVLDGGHMADFCRQRDIAYTTMYDWVRSDDRRAELYLRAREDRAEKFADEIVAISDEATVTAKHMGEEVVLVLDAAAVSRNKLRVDSRKWIAAKLKPRVYGDKVQVEGVIDHKGMADDVLLTRLAKFNIALSGIVPKPEQEAPDVGG